MTTAYDKALAYLVKKTTPKFVFYTIDRGYDIVIDTAIEVALAIGDNDVAKMINEEGTAHVQ